MPREIIRIHEDKGWLNIGYLAVLSHPTDRDKQNMLIRAAYTHLYKGAGTRRMQIPEEYRKMRPREADRVLRNGFGKIFRDRLCAAYYALCYSGGRHVSGDWSQERYGTYKPGDRIFATDRFIGLLESEEVKVPQYEKSFNKRMWKDSKSVLHLAIALPWNKSHNELLFDHSWAEGAFELAEEFRLILPEVLPDFEESETFQIIPTPKS